jgi:hypothetical protein
MTTPRTNFFAIVQTLAAYVAVPVALVYPFGFVALFLQFMRYFGLEFYTSWYAVSLVHRMVVIGQGATILIVALTGSVLFSGMVGRILLLYDDRTGVERFGPRATVVSLTLVSSIALVLYVLYSRILAAGRVSWLGIAGSQSNECRDNAMRHQLNLWPDSLVPASIFVLGILLGGLLIYGAHFEFSQRSSVVGWRYPVVEGRLRGVPDFFSRLWSLARSTVGFFIRGVTQKWILPGLTVAYVFGVAASLWLAWSTPAFMPYVNFGFTSAVSDAQPVPEESSGEQGLFYTKEPPSQPTSDRFLSHADGHWHFLHRGKSPAGKREYRVISLQEGEVSYARVVDAGVKARVAPFPWEDPSTTDLKPCAKFHW